MNIFEQIQQYITKQKHVLIIGKTQTERHKFLVELSRHLSYQIIWFPASMTSFDEYLQTVEIKKLFNAYFPAKGKYYFAQIYDYHRDWIEVNKLIFVLEEFHKMEEVWKIELLSMFIENLEKNKRGATLLIISQDEVNGLLSKLKVNSNAYKSSEQIINSNLKIVEI
jgi:hypothetical protein